MGTRIRHHASSLPPDYLNKIYAGILGKLIGVYLGRPFENWTHQEILEKLGPIHYYVHEELDLPLVVIDDDVSGTFAFVRALEEHGATAELSSEEVGKTWLNQVIEKKTIFWWGGNGISTEHTTFNNLKKGVKPPESGSIRTNGQTIAEQIGAQIFIDGWALVSPGKPKQAARLAEAAARVSHDGVAVHAAVLWAAMEAEAFLSKDVDHLLDTGLLCIPSDSSITKLVRTIRAWVKEDNDWNKTRGKIEEMHGYDKYGGICHMIPNHGIMIMALLYGAHDFNTAMHIINTCGWDTDCNSGNVGCLVAIMHGLDAFKDSNGFDWRGPLADRALISSADGGYSINNAVRITYDLANLTHRLAGEEPLSPPKDGAQFHFSLPGSVQGFQTFSRANIVSIAQGVDDGTPALGIQLHKVTTTEPAIEVLTDTFTPLQVLKVKRGYEMMASPLIYPGQTVTAILHSDSVTKGNADVCLRVKAYASDDTLISLSSHTIFLSPGSEGKLEWQIPAELENKPITALGIAIWNTPSPVNYPFEGTVWLCSMKYSGPPSMTLTRPTSGSGNFWQHTWVSSVHKSHRRIGPSFYLAQDSGEGLHVTGTREWDNYSMSVNGFTVHLGSDSGVVFRMQGLNRYYALQFHRSPSSTSSSPNSSSSSPSNSIRIIRARDAARDVIAEALMGWEYETKYYIHVDLLHSGISAKVGDTRLEVCDEVYTAGGAGFLVSEGCVSAEDLSVGKCSRLSLGDDG